MRGKVPPAAAALLAFIAFAGEPGLAQQRLFGPGLFVSPAGEPFRPAPGPAPIEAWFLAADTNRDGALNRDELRADFARFFATLDRDDNGEIAPAEVARYELEILPEMRGIGQARGRALTSSEMRRDNRVRGAGRRVGSTMMAAGVARFGLLPLSHPIMAADTDFNGGVSRGEFESAALRRFGDLDTAGDGELSLTDLRERRRHLARRRD